MAIDRIDVIDIYNQGIYFILIDGEEFFNCSAEEYGRGAYDLVISFANALGKKFNKFVYTDSICEQDLADHYPGIKL